MNYDMDISGCTSEEAVPVQETGFSITDNDDSIPDDSASIYSPGERDHGYAITIKPSSGEGAESLIPMSISTMEGDNIKEIVVRIVPKDTNIPPTKLTVITFLCILYFIHFIIF